MPFGSYEESPAIAFRNAARVIQETGATAVKLEGGTRMAETIRYLTQRGIPVMGHIGLTPQMVNVRAASAPRAAPRRNGRRWRPMPRRWPRPAPSPSCWKAWPSRWPPRSPAEIAIPTIGIGASPACDGQILVMEDMLGLNPNPPKFVREYAQLGPAIEAAVKAYAGDVRERRFPGAENVYPMKKAQ